MTSGITLLKALAPLKHSALGMSSPPVVADDTVTEEQKRGKKRFKIAGMKINSLRSIAKHFGLGGKGKKKELIARIEGADVDLEEAVDVAGEALADSPGQTR